MKKKQKLFNGKPMKHWDNLADDLVMDCLVRDIHNLDARSIVGKKAISTLVGLAYGLDPLRFQKKMEERENWQRSAVELLLSAPKKLPKHLGKKLKEANLIPKVADIPRGKMLGWRGKIS